MQAKSGTQILYEFTNDVENDIVAKYIKQLRQEKKMDATRTKTNHEIKLEKQKMKQKRKKSM